MNWLIHHGKRVLRITAGLALVVFGIIDLPLPGPGTLFIIAGLSILAIDFVWARRLKRQLKSHAGRAMRKMRGQPDKKSVTTKKV